MNQAQALLKQLKEQDISLDMENGRLCYDAPSGALSDSLRADLKASKDSISKLMLQELKRRFNLTLREYENLESWITSHPLPEPQNSVFKQNETKWQKLFDELNQLLYQIGDKNFTRGVSEAGFILGERKEEAV